MTTYIFESLDQFWRKAILKLFFVLFLITGCFWLMVNNYFGFVWTLIQNGQIWWQSKLRFYDFLEIYLYYFLIFVLIRRVWYFFWDQFHYLAKGLYQITAMHLVRKNRLELLIRLIQWNTLWYSRFYELIISRSRISELDYVRLLYGRNSLSRLIKTSPRLLIIIKNFFIGLLSIPSLCALMFVIAIQTKGSLNAALQALLDWLTDADIKSVFIYLLSNIPNAIVLFGMVFILFYLNNLKGIVRRTIANANKNKLEEAINIHRTLSPLINRGLTQAIGNMETIRWSVNQFTNIWLCNRYENVKGIKQVLPCSMINETLNDVCERLEPIPEIAQIVQIINQPDELFWMQRHVQNLSYKLRGWWLFLGNDKEENLHQWWFTPSGLTIMFNVKPRHSPNEIERLILRDDLNKAKEMLEEGRQFMERNIYKYMIRALEAQVLLFAYAQHTSMILQPNSDKFGRALRSLFDREG